MMQGFRVLYVWVVCGSIVLSGCKSSNTSRKTVIGVSAVNATMGVQKKELESILPAGTIIEFINYGNALKITFDSDILFVANSNTIHETSKSVLRRFATNLINHPGTFIQITGHTDNTGRADYNQTLSERRSKSVYDYLCELGIDTKRMDYAGKGFREPIAKNNSSEGRAMNRRVEIVIEKFVANITQ